MERSLSQRPNLFVSNVADEAFSLSLNDGGGGNFCTSSNGNLLTSSFNSVMRY